MGITTLLFLVLLVSPGLTQTIDDYFNFQSINYLTASPSTLSGLVAWVGQRAGVSNIFMFDTSNASGSAIQVTNFKGDAALEIGNLCWSPDELLFFTLSLIEGANSLNLRKPFQNQILVTSATLPAPAIISSDGSTLLTCKTETATILSPDGLVITDLKINRSDGRVVKSQELLQLQNGNFQGSVGVAQWNPLETHLAFDNNRVDHGLVGIVSTGDPQITWLAATFHFNQNPVWSVDGKYLAFYRIRPVTNNFGMFGQSLRSAFSVVVAEVATGRSWEIYKDNKYGFPDPNRYGMRPLVWSVDNKVIFSTTETGWLHVSAVDIQTKKQIDLSPGTNCEVQDYQIDYKRTGVYLAHNCDNIDTSGITHVVIATREFTSVTPGVVGEVSGMAGAGFGMASTVLDGFIEIRTTYNESSTVQFYASSTSRPKQISPSGNAPSSKTWVEPTIVKFRSADGIYTIHSQLFMPAGGKPGQKYPAMVFTHGGPMRQMYCAPHFEPVYAQLYAFNQYLVSQGMVVLSINYRLGVGYGYDFEYCKNCGDQGAAEYQDVKSGAEWLKSRNIVLDDQLGIYGLSYGGLNTLQAIARDSDLFKAGVASAPVFNWISADRSGNDPRFQYVPLLPGTNLGLGPEANLATPEWSANVDKNIKLAYESSPAGHLDTWKSPVLLIHGDSDRSVDVQESIGLVRALEDRGVVVETLMVPNESHGMGLYKNQLMIFNATISFFRQYLL